MSNGYLLMAGNYPPTGPYYMGPYAETYSHYTFPSLSLAHLETVPMKPIGYSSVTY